MVERVSASDPQPNSYAAIDHLREPVVRAAIRWLGLPKGSSGLDAGCGTGWQSQLLADAVGEEGHISALDRSSGVLGYALDLAQEAGFGERISFHEGDVTSIPFPKSSFDWIWSADTVGYPAPGRFP